MSIPLYQQAHEVNSREDLVRFIHALLHDLEDNPDDWENPTLDRYLEAMAAWVHDMHGYYRNRGERMPEVLTWRHVADILMAARIYE
jgi:hypothetical protein